MPETARRLVSAKIAELLDERDAHGKKKLTQARLGQLLGVSQEAARRAREPDGVTPAIVNGMSHAFRFYVMADERIETTRTHDDGSKTSVVTFPMLQFPEEKSPDRTTIVPFPERVVEVDDPHATRQDEAIEILVRRGVKLRRAMSAVRSIVAFKTGEELSPDALASLAYSLLMADDKLRVSPQARFDPDQPERRGPMGKSSKARKSK